MAMAFVTPVLGMLSMPSIGVGEGFFLGCWVVLSVWMLASMVVFVASNRPGLRLSLRHAAGRVQDALRAALYCTVVVWRLPALPWAVYAALGTPGLAARAAYREGLRLARAKLIGSAVGLLLASAAAYALISAGQWVEAAVPLIPILLGGLAAYAVPRSLDLDSVNPEIFD